MKTHSKHLIVAACALTASFPVFADDQELRATVSINDTRKPETDSEVSP